MITQLAFRPVLAWAKGVVLLIVTGVLAGCAGPSEQQQQANVQAEKKVNSVDAGNFDKLVLKSEVPVLIWFYSSKSSDSSRLHPVIESVSDHYAASVKVVKIDHSKTPQIKWTIDPLDPEPWSKWAGCGVWILRFPDGRLARFGMIRIETESGYGPTAEQIQWFVDHAAQVAPLTTSGGAAGSR